MKLIVFEDGIFKQVDSTFSLEDLTDKSHTLLDDIGVNTHAEIDSHINSITNPHAVTKSQVGLGSVENVALSTWAGSLNFTTAGNLSVLSLTTASLTLVSNLNADYLDGLHASAFSLTNHTHAGYEPIISSGTTSQYYRGDKSWQTLDKAAVGLGSVENTALSTWAGTTNLVTAGNLSITGLTTSSSALVTNLNADTLDGVHAAGFELIVASGTTSQYYRGDKSWQTLDKAAVGLGSVENTALSTWAGTTNLVTIGAATATSLTTPTVIGGTGVASTLTLRSTSGVGASGADLIFQTGSNGATEVFRALNKGFLMVGATTKPSTMTVQAKADFVATGTSSANASTTITGVNTVFLSEIGIGDRISLSSAAATYSLVTAIASDTSLTVQTAIGNGTSQTINVKKSIFRTNVSAATPNFIIDDSGNLIIKNGYNLFIDNNTGNAGSYFFNTNNAANSVHFGNNSGTNGMDVIGNAAVQFKSTNSNGSFAFSTKPAGTSGARTNIDDFFIANSGNVAVGTASGTALFQVNQTTVGSGTVATSGTTALVGTNTLFTNIFKVGDTITVQGETVRTIATITDDTNLTVTLAFSTTGSGKTFALTGGVRFAVKGNGYSGVNTASPNSYFNINGSLSLAYVAKTANYTLTDADHIVDCTANTFTITLPTAVGITGRVYNIKNSGTGAITIATTSSQTIDGNASGVLVLSQYDNLTVTSNNANWIIL